MNSDKKKILLVEDEVPMFNALKEKLISHGFEILGARNGQEGVEIALKEHPDLIVADIIMPKMDGVTMMKKLREDPWGTNVPIIILTNLNPDDSTIKMIEANEPSYYLVKSDWNINDLIDKIKERLDM